MKVNEIKMLRRISEPNREEATGRCRELHKSGIIICTLQEIPLARSNKEAGGKLTHTGKKNTLTIFLSEDLKGRDHLEDISIDGIILLK
jgi:hypothetical protein